MSTKALKLRMVSIGCVLLMAIAVVTGQPGVSTAPEVSQVENRCGWFSNPTPANASLYDRDAEWIVGVQGGHQAEGDWPSFGPGQWIKTNVNYGYGCACMRVRVNHDSHEVITIESARARPLSACRSDSKLKRWGFK
jgi:hypothetical protein